jgi:DNA-binding CsgD family transcriptional regulator
MVRNQVAPSPASTASAPLVHSAGDIASLRNQLAYVEPFPSDFLDTPASAEQAVWLLDPFGRVLRLNPLASEALEHSQAFRIEDQLLKPFRPAQDTYWFDQISQVRRSGKPSMALLSASSGRVAIGLNPRSQGHLAVFFEVNLQVSDELLELFARSANLTPTEIDVVRLMLMGMRPKAIAQARSRSEATVRSHIKNLLSKSGCVSVQELLVMLTRLPKII